jgi:hypothetical protein
MSSEGSTPADMDTLLDRLRSVSSTLQRAERSALGRIRSVERALFRCAPKIEVWTQALFQDQSRQSKGTAAPKTVTRSVSLGFAPISRLPQLEPWLASAQLSGLGKRWRLVIREESRNEGAKQTTQRISLLAKADLDLRLALAPHLETLVRAIHDEVRTRVDRLPSQLAPSGAQTQTSRVQTTGPTPEETPPVLEPGIS